MQKFFAIAATAFIVVAALAMVVSIVSGNLGYLALSVAWLGVSLGCSAHARIGAGK